MLITVFITDFSLDIARFILDDDINDDEPWTNYGNPITAFLFDFSTTVVFLTFFLICTLGMIDIAKVE